MTSVEMPLSPAVAPRIERLASGLAAIAAVAIVGIALMTILDVALRSLLSVTIRGLNEILVLALGVSVAACLPAGFARAVHLAIDLFTALLPRRVAAVLAVVGAALLFVFVAVLGIELWQLAQTYDERTQRTIILGWQIAPFYYAMAALVLMCVPIQAMQVWAAVARVREEPGPAASAALAMPVLVGIAAVAIWLGPVVGLPAHGPFAGLMPTAVALAGFAAMWIAMLMGVPLAAAMGLSGFLGIAAFTGFGPAGVVVGSETGKFLTSETLAVLPMFLLMGSFASVAGLSADLYRFGYELLRPLRGSLAHATIAGCAGFGALTGSSLATAATFGKVALPEMRARGYEPALATGAIAAGGTLGSLVPPSTAVILFALLAEQSIGRMFMAAIGPAMLAIALYLLAIYLLLKARPNLAPEGSRIEKAALLRAARDCWGAVTLFGTVIGGIYTGIFTDAEAASVGAVGAFLFALFRGKLGGGRLWSVLAGTTETLALIYLLIFGAVTFSFLVAFTQVPATISAVIVDLGIPPLGVVVLLILAYLLLGMVMDSYAMMVITTPIFLPLVVQSGFDPIWWGTVTVICVELGMITPPFGMNLFMLNSIAKDISLRTIYRGVMPFVAADLVKIAILIALPAIALWLPSRM